MPAATSGADVDCNMFRFMSGVRNEVERIDRQLHLFSDTLDEWVACQKEWMYLKTIFSAPDIQRQLPHEAKAFAAVDKQFKDVMRRTRERSNAMQAATTPGDNRNNNINLISTHHNSNDDSDSGSACHQRLATHNITNKGNKCKLSGVWWLNRSMLIRSKGHACVRQGNTLGRVACCRLVPPQQ